MTYKAKPAQIEAFQLDVTTAPGWFVEALKDGRARLNAHHFDTQTADGMLPAKGCLVRTIEGNWAPVRPRDYICKDSEGGLYPCKASIFEKKYEAL